MHTPTPVVHAIRGQQNALYVQWRLFAQNIGVLAHLAHVLLITGGDAGNASKEGRHCSLHLTSEMVVVFDGPVVMRIPAYSNSPSGHLS